MLKLNSKTRNRLSKVPSHTIQYLLLLYTVNSSLVMSIAFVNNLDSIEENESKN